MSRPNPTLSKPTGKTDKQIISERNTTCNHYGDCLNTAIRQNWRGFSCQKCEAFSYEDLAPYHGFGASRDGYQPEEIYGQF